MFHLPAYFLFALCAVFLSCSCQEYDFAAEMTRQCLVPDPVGLVDCVEAKVTLPYLTSWVDCTNGLGGNVKTSADVVNYRCKSVWEGKGLIPEVFYLKDCVIEKTGLPAKNVSAEVLGAYKECESTPSSLQQRIKTAPIQQQQLRVSSVEYKPSTQQFQAPAVRPPQQPVQVQVPIQQFQAPISFQPQNVASRQQFQAPLSRPVQIQVPVAVQRPIQQQIQAPIFRPVQQAPPRTVQQFPARPAQFTQQQIPVGLNPQNQPAVSRPQYQIPAVRPQYPSSSINPTVQRQPFSQQFFVIYPQASFPNQQQNMNNPILSRKTAPNPAFVPQQQILMSSQQINSVSPNVPHSYSFQINHPLRQVS